MSGYLPGTKEILYATCNGFCSYCGNPMNRSEVIAHHVCNRKNGGSSDIRNLILRHKNCEIICHSKYRNGNPEEGVKNVSKERDGIYHNKSKYRQSAMPHMPREARVFNKRPARKDLLPTTVFGAPRAFLRPVNPNRPMPRQCLETSKEVEPCESKTYTLIQPSLQRISIPC